MHPSWVGCQPRQVRLPCLGDCSPRGLCRGFRKRKDEVEGRSLRCGENIRTEEVNNEEGQGEESSWKVVV